MENDLNFAKNKIIGLFKNSKANYWKTIEEISEATNIDSITVSKTLTNSGDFVRSSYRQKAGEPLYTTREIFRNKAPFVDKLIGALKNRID